jgi:hypothetical protein
MLFSNPLERMGNSLRVRLELIMKKLCLSSKVNDVKFDVNKVVTEAEISAQSEMVKRTLAEREEKIKEGLRPQNDIRQAKDLTRQDLYAMLIKGRRNDRAKNNTNALTR